MYVCLPLALVIFVVASSCAGFPAETPGSELRADDSPKDEYGDVIRLLKSSAEADAEANAGADAGKQANADHAGKARRHPLAPTDWHAVSSSPKKISKSSPVKKHKTRNGKKKHIAKKEKNIDLDDQLVNDSPHNERVREVLSRRRISAKVPTKTHKSERLILAQPLPLSLAQPVYEPTHYQPNYYDYQSPYPTYSNDYSFPPQYPSFVENNNWDNNIQISQLPSQQKVHVPHVEPPTFTWAMEIEYPNMPPIVITDKNYTDNPDVDVVVHPAVELLPAPAMEEPSLKKTRSVPSHYSSPPIIWSHGIPYVPLRQPQYLGSPHASQQYNPMMTSYSSMVNPYNYITPPVYYHPPSQLPYTQNTPVQTWLPSNQPYYPTWPSVQEQSRYANVYPAHSGEQRGFHATVFHDSKEVTGENIEVNVFPESANADANADDVDSEEVKPRVVAASNEDDADW